MTRSPAKPVSQADIARLAGVSTATVSLALNGHPRLSQATRQRVTEVASHLGYDFTANLEARSLRARGTGKPVLYHALGMVWASKQTPMVGDSFHRMMLDGIVQACWSHDLVLSLLNTTGPGPSRGLNALARVDGVIVPLERPAAVHHARQAGKPTVTVFGGGPTQSGVTDVAVDHQDVVRQAFEHLHAHGHRAVGYLGTDMRSPVAAQRWAAYCRCLEAAGLTYREHHLDCQSPGLEHQHGAEAFNRLWSNTTDDKPTALIVYNDTMALGVLDAARQRGLRVPRDLSLVSIDGIPETAESDPPLTTVAVDMIDLGQRIVTYLLERAGIPPEQPEQLCAETALVQRASVAPPRQS
ncbi:MAG: LacI family DNA-binding transcriptional regulator [Phycisphaeraceae bacterium]